MFGSVFQLRCDLLYVCILYKIKYKEGLKIK